MTTDNDLFQEARALMNAEEMPNKVSNKLLWAAVSENNRQIKKINGIVSDVKWLKWGFRATMSGLIWLAAALLSMI